ncbi:helix-turn-helix domain-containing protein, partial [Trebonia sp.]|uniref:helix-turn-helix domain-containing protein n=1 Tax=Trebonia sp. TaxID=2767075 RepID=UPI002617ECAA
MSVGEALAEARYRAGLTLDEVSERSRIREAVILSIEQDDYDACGGELYVRGYVRAIASAIGIDAQPLIREYDEGQANAPVGARLAVTRPDAAALSAPTAPAVPSAAAVPSAPSTRSAASAPSAR